MTKYHINARGEAGACTAQEANCPFGGDAQHYATPVLARQAFELSLAPATLPTVIDKNSNKGDAFAFNEKQVQVLIDHFLITEGPGALSPGEMISFASGRPKLIKLSLDVTAPENAPEPFGRWSAPRLSNSNEESLEDYHQFEAFGKNEHRKQCRIMESPVFDLHHAGVRRAARERVDIINASLGTYGEIQAALKLTSTKEEAADYLIASHRKAHPQPKIKEGATFQRWQARTNLIGEYVQTTELNDERARWCLDNMRPVKYHYKQF